MTFQSLDFLIFFLLVLALNRLARTSTLQNIMLVALSYLFYGYVHSWYLWLMLYVTAVSYASARWMERPSCPRRLVMWITVAALVEVLFIFKYFDFFAANIQALLTGMGMSVSWPLLNILLPVGISFYVFEAICYVVDVYRKDIPAERNLVTYSLFLAFFCKLNAGPIERTNTLLPQLRTLRRPDAQDLAEGMLLMSYGFFKKLVIADNVGVIVNRFFIAQNPGTLSIAIATLGFTLQILADFGGYTDIARGCARMLGIRLSRNFDNPYIAVSPSDFWRRWHMTLSNWIRDYIYLPLKGQHDSLPRQGAILLFTFTLVGLWHGASWHYVLWGSYHGLLVFSHRLWRKSAVSGWMPGIIRDIGGRMLTFIAISFGLSIFREADLHWLYLAWLGKATSVPDFTLDTNIFFLGHILLYALPMFLVMVMAAVIGKMSSHTQHCLRHPVLSGAAAGTLVAATIVLSARDVADFIYFAF